MNYLVCYHTPTKRVKRKTFTFVEAKAIADNASSKSFTCVSIKPLNSVAEYEMDSCLSLDRFLSKVLSRYEMK